MMIDTINKVRSGVCYLDMSVYTGRKSDDDGERCGPLGLLFVESRTFLCKGFELR